MLMSKLYKLSQRNLMRKIEKPTIKHKTIEEKPVLESPYGTLDEAFPECKGKLLYVWESEVLDEDNYKPRGQFFVVDAFGGHLFFRTNSRAKAQHLCDLCFNGKYTVKVVVRAAVR